MATHLDSARAVHFARFVRRALDRAKAARGWSVAKIAKEAGIGEASINRWLKGQWDTAPEGDKVTAFCDALDIPRSIAVNILWPDRNGPVGAVESLPDIHPAIKIIMRKLNDPRLSRAERFHITQTLEMLASPPRAEQ